MAASIIGKTVGKYQIVEHLGRGGMAEVYKAYQPGLDRYVAIKLMHSFLAEDEDFLGRFQREARAVASLRHPNIVQVYDFDVADGMYFMVMEFIDGETLKNHLQQLAVKNETMPLEEAIRITRGVASALAYAHGRDMVHRDVKPANVMLNRENTPILTDFGIAKILSGPQYTASGAMIGTPAYMSPEQGLGKPGDARSDIYSLGTMLFQMATGQLPYDADTPLAVVLKHVNDPMPIPSRINPALPPAVERVIFKAMAKDPGDRYQSAGQLIDHLDRIQAGQAIPETIGPTAIGQHAQPTAADATVLGAPAGMREIPRPRAKPAKKRLIPWIAGGALLVLAIVAGGAVGLAGLLGARETPPATTVAALVATQVIAPTTPAPPTATYTPAPTATPLDLLAAASTALAQQNATLTAQAPTVTPTYTPTPQPSPTPVPECENAYDLAAFFTYDNPRGYNAASGQTSAPVNSQFPLTVQLINRGTCPWAAGAQIVLLEGDSMGAEKALPTAQEVAVGDTAAFDLSMTSGSAAGLSTSTWKLQAQDGSAIGEPLEIRVSVYLPATPTPVQPTQPPPTETPAVTGPIDFNYFAHDCEYAGPDWRCWLTLTPYNGAGQPYTFFIFDSDQPSRYYGGNAEHLIGSRRCFAWVHEIKLQDDGGNEVSKNIYISPNDVIPGGCTEP